MINFTCSPKPHIFTSAFIDKSGQEILNSVKSSRYIEVLNVLMGKLMTNMYKDKDNPYTLLSLRNSATRSKIYNQLKTELVNNEYFDNLNDDVKADLNLIYQNWDLFATYHSKFSGYAPTEENFEYVYFEDDVISNNLDDSEAKEIKTKIDGREGNSYNDLELAGNELQLLFRFLPKTEFNAEEYTFKEALKEDGLPQQSDYLNIVKLLIDKTKGVRKEAKFFSILSSKQAFNIIPELGVLRDILGFDNLDNLNDKQIKLLNQFYILFSRSYSPVWSSKKILTAEENTHIFFKNTKGNADKISENFQVGFQIKAILPQHAEYIKVDNSVEADGNRNNASEYGYNRRRLVALPIPFLPIVKEENEIEDLSIDDIKEEYAKHFDFIRMLGIELTGLDLVDSTEEKTSLIRNVLNRVPKMMQELQNRLNAGQYIFNPLEDLRSSYKVKLADGTKQTFSSYTYFRKDIINFESQFSKLASTMMSRNAEGEKQSDITLANAFTIAFDTIKTSESEEELLNSAYFYDLNNRNPQYKNSFIRRNVISKDGVMTIRTGNYNGFELAGDNETKDSTRNLTAKQKYISDFANLLMYSTVNPVQLERKSTYPFFQFNQGGVHILPVQTSLFGKDFTSNPKFLEQILFYIHGEVNRVKTYPASIGEQKGLNQFNQFKFMENLLIPISKMEQSEIDTLQDPNSNLSQSLKNAINTYFNERLDAHNNFIKVNNIDIGNLIPNNLIKDVVDAFPHLSMFEIKEQNKDTFLRSFIANSYIINTEFMIYVAGNPVFVKDAHKRFGIVASTGIQATTEDFFNNLFKYDPKEQAFFESYSLRGIMNNSKEFNTEVRRDNSKNFTTAVLVEDMSTNNAYTKAKTVTDYIKSVKRKDGTELTREEAEKELLVDSIKNKGVAVGDGQGYMNLDFHREMSKRQGVFRDEHDISYKLESLIFKKHILKQELSEQEELLYSTLENTLFSNPHKYALPTLKQVYYGTVLNSDLKVDGKASDKFSLHPLRPSEARDNPKLTDLLKTMAVRQIGYVKYKSGSKNFIRQVLTTEQLKKADLDLYSTDLLKLQILPSEEEKTKTGIPTQEVSLLFSNLFNNGDVQNPEIKKVRDKFIETLKKIQKANKLTVLAGLGINQEGNWDLQKLVKKIEGQVNLQKLPSSLLKGLEIDSKTGKFVHSLESSGVYKQVMDYIIGYIDTELRTFKINGGDFVLVSSSMMETQPTYYEYNDNGTKPAGCFITLNKEFTKLLQLKDPQSNTVIGTIERLNELLRNEQFVEENKKALTVSFSRPPIDGTHSMGVAIVEKFIYPTAGNVFILPQEYLHQAGIDYDYDKEKVLIPNLSNEGLFVSIENAEQRLKDLETEYSDLREIYNYVEDYVQEADSYEEWDELRTQLLGSDNFTKLLSDFLKIDPLTIPEQLEDISRRAAEYIKQKDILKKSMINELLSSINEGILLPEAYSELIIPSNTEFIKSLAMQNAEELKNVNGFNAAVIPVQDKIYDYLENLNVFKMFNDAASLLGPFALDNTISQVLAQHNITIPLAYSFKEGIPQKVINNLILSEEEKDSITNEGRISITNRKNLAGEINQHLRSEYISFTVDSAKDPSFANLLISFENINTVSFLTYLGYPAERIKDFIGSTVIRKFIEYKHEEFTTTEAFEAVLNSMGIDVITSENGIRDIDMNISNNKTLKDNLTNESELDNLKKYKTVILNDLTKIEISDNIKLLANFIAMEDHAKNMTRFKNLFKNNTNKVNSLFDILAKENNRKITVKTGMFSEDTIRKIENDSTITPYRNDNFIKEIITSISPLFSEKDVLSTLSEIYNSRKSENSTSSAILSNILTADFLTFNLFSFGIYEENGNEIKLFDYAQKLIRKDIQDPKSSKVLLDRLLSLKENKNYEKIVNQFPVIELIQGFISSKRIENNAIYKGSYAYNLQLNTPADIQPIQQENYQEQFEQIINNNYDFGDEKVNEALNKFVKDFFIAGLLQSGFNKTGLSYYDYMPISFIQSLLNPTLEAFEKMDKETRSAFLSSFSGQLYKNNSKFFSPRIIGAAVEESTHLGKFYGNYNSLEDIKYFKGERNEVTTKEKVEDGKITNDSNVELFKGFWTRNEVAEQTDKVFLFGDNTDDRIVKYVPSSTQAVIRGLPNAIGIDTKNNRKENENSYLNDSDFDRFKLQVDNAIKQAKETGKTIVIPADGIGTGKAMLQEKAPKLFAYLEQQLDLLKKDSFFPKYTDKKISFQEEQTSGYKNRTIKNASADATIALAVDFNSAGEKLTKSSVLNQGKLYIPIDLNNSDIVNAEDIVKKLNSVNAKTLNIAGNGIYTMKGKGDWTQQQLDDYVYELLKEVINSPNLNTKIESIRTGGQTGLDEAGTKAGIKLGLPTLTLAPKGWTFRNIEGKDISDEKQFKARFGVNLNTTQGDLFNSTNTSSVQIKLNTEDGENYTIPILNGTVSVGTISATNDGSYLNIIGTDITMQKQGIGTQSYIALGNEAFNLGLQLRSDKISTRTNEGSVGLWNSLVNQNLAEKVNDHYVFTGIGLSEQIPMILKENVDNKLIQDHINNCLG